MPFAFCPSPSSERLPEAEVDVAALETLDGRAAAELGEQLPDPHVHDLRIGTIHSLCDQIMTEFDDEHLPGATSLPLKSLTAGTSAVLDRSRPVIVYCWDGL